MEGAIRTGAGRVVVAGGAPAAGVNVLFTGFREGTGVGVGSEGIAWSDARSPRNRNIGAGVGEAAADGVGVGVGDAVGLTRIRRVGGPSCANAFDATGAITRAPNRKILPMIRPVS